MATRDTASPPLAFAGRLGIAAGDLARTLAPVLFAGWLLLVVIPGRPNLGPAVHDATVQTEVLFGALFLAYVAYLLLARKLPDCSPLDWCALGLLAAYALATLTSVDSRVSTEASLQVLACIAAFYAFHERGFLTTDTLVRSLVILAGLAAIQSLLQVAAAYSEWAAALDAIRGLRASDLMPPPLLRSRGVLDHPNHLAMLLNLALPFALLMAVRSRPGWDRVLGVTVAIAACVAMLFTQSRGAWFGLMLAQPLFWTLVYLHSGRRLTLGALLRLLQDHRRIVVPLAAAVLALGGGAFLYVVAIQPPWLFRATLGPRFETFEAGIRMFLDHPLAGAGPGTFGLLNEAYGIRHPDAQTIIHNAYLQVLADIGLAGAVAVLAGGLVIAASTLRAWQAGRPEARVLLAAAASAIVASLVHGLLDSPPAWNTVLLPFALVIAVAMRQVPAPAGFARPRFHLRTLAPRLASLALIPLVLAGWLATDRGHSTYDASLRALDAGRLEPAASLAVAAAERDSGLAAYQLHAGVSLVHLHIENPDARPSALDEGIAHLTRAAALDPHSSLAYANLALALQLDGNHAAAAGAARRAMLESPSDTTIARVAGSVFEDAGLPLETVRAYATAVSLEPALAQSTFWTSTPEREAMRPAVLQAAGLDACTAGRYAALYGVYTADLPALTDACRGMVESAGGVSNSAGLALMLFAQGNPDEARDYARRAISANPRNPHALVASAVVLGDGDLTRVRTDLYRAAQYADKDAAALLAVTYLAPGTLEPNVLALPSLPQRPDALPARARAQLSRVAPSGAQTTDEVSQAYTLGRMYYNHAAFREAPDRLLLPGDWSDLVSPAVFLALQAQSTSR